MPLTIGGRFATGGESRNDVDGSCLWTAGCAHLIWELRSISSVGAIIEAVIRVWDCSWFIPIVSVRDRWIWRAFIVPVERGGRLFIDPDNDRLLDEFSD